MSSFITCYCTAEDISSTVAGLMNEDIGSTVVGLMNEDIGSTVAGNERRHW
jgi:hypothetical protein